MHRDIFAFTLDTHGSFKISFTCAQAFLPSSITGLICSKLTNSPTEKVSVNGNKKNNLLKSHE
jgi:hypothetical protein